MTSPRTSTDIRAAGYHDGPQIAAVLAAAFLDGDLASWLVPDRQARRRAYRPYFEMLTADALLHGRVDITGDGHGVALWYVRGDGRAVPPIPHYRQRLGDIFADYVDGFHALDDATEHHHPPGPPHHYLQHLAVHPDRQRLGHGSRLLEHHHRLADGQDLPCYLEATGERNQALYERHGYRPRTPFPLGLGAPLLFPMWRLPAGRSTSGGER